MVAKGKKRVLAMHPTEKKWQTGVLDVVRSIIRFATGHKVPANSVKFQEKPYVDEIK